MKNQYASRLRRAIPLVVVLSLFTSVFTSLPSALADPPYHVTYNGNGNTGGTIPVDSTSYTSGQLVTVLGQGDVSRAGFTFGGWSYSGGMGTQVVPSFNIFVDTTLTAVWNPVTTYAITYIGNGNTGGTAPIDGSAYTNGATVSVLGQNGLLKTGYTFGGWATGGGAGPVATYSPGATFTISANTTLTAIWNLNGFTVTYLSTGSDSGTPPQDSNSPYASGSTVTVLGQNTLVKTGYTFGGWKDFDTGVLFGATFVILTSHDLLPVWTPIPGPTPSPTPSGTSSPSPTPSPTPTSTTGTKVVFTITYLGNTNNTGLPPAPTVGFGFVTLASNTGVLVKNGFGFDGWNTKADGSGISYPVTSSYSLIANVTLYAQWNPNIIYTITYDGNDSTDGTAPPSTTGIGTVILSTNSGPLVKVGETFYGWNTKADGSGTSYRAAGSFLLSQNVTLFAVFIPLVVGKNPPSLIVNGKIINTAPPKKIALNQIVPVHQQFLTVLPKNAVGFQLYENGKFILSGKSNSANLKSIVGPKDRVDVVAVGKDGSKSAPSPVKLSKDPISLANINFNTDSYQFIGPATKILDQVASVMLKHGYTKLEIWGYVDTQGSKASWIVLSKNRALAVKNYMTKKLLGSGITIKNAGRAQTQAVGNNNTAAGRALNRRVEIRVS
ncbi:MAG: InlB B-repeat-containing protein [Candidatus Nanopelagicaceae bacterium]|nr:InlB B-repeat-containing protein [Candidatus Nanopelagicaceae bacterium]